MAFRKVDSTFKLDVIKALWRGMNYTQLSDKYSIPRSTIYQWEQTAKEAIINAFENKTPGKRTIDLKEQNHRLKEQLQSLYHIKHKSAQDGVESPFSEPAPIICSNCGSSHIKKNGTVLTKCDGLRQRYSCTTCSLSIYLDVKKNLSQSN
ncbi:MAG: helix-turn-helix domain-containing protein [bacterium]